MKCRFVYFWIVTKQQLLFGIGIELLELLTRQNRNVDRSCLLLKEL